MGCKKNDFLSRELEDLQKELIDEIKDSGEFKDKLKKRLQDILENVSLYNKNADCDTNIDPDQVRLKTIEVEKEYRYYEPQFFPLPSVGKEKCYLNAQPGLIITHAQKWKHNGFTLGGLVFSTTLLPGEELELEYKTFDSIKTSKLTELEHTQKDSRNIEDRTSDSWEIVDSVQTRLNNEQYNELNTEIAAELEGKMDPMAAAALGLGGAIAAGGLAVGAAVAGLGIAAAIPSSGVSLPAGLGAGALISTGAGLAGTAVGALGGIAGLVSASGDKNYIKGKVNGAISTKDTERTAAESQSMLQNTHKTLHEHTEKSATEVSKRNAVKIDIAKERREESSKIRKIKNINQCHAVSFHHFQLKKVFAVSSYAENARLALFGPKVDAAEIVRKILAEYSSPESAVESRQPSSGELEINLGEIFNDRDSYYKERFEYWLGEIKDKLFDPNNRFRIKLHGRNKFGSDHEKEYTLLERHINEYMQNDFAHIIDEGQKESIKNQFIIDAAHILAYKQADDGMTARLVKLIQSAIKNRAAAAAEEQERERMKKIMEDALQKLNLIQSGIRKKIIDDLKTSLFEYENVCYDEGYSYYFSPDVESSLKLLRPVWICNFSISRDETAASPEPASVIKKSGMSGAFEFLLSKMKIKARNNDERRKKEREFFNAFLKIVDSLLTNAPVEKIHTVNTNGVYVEAMQSRCTACEPYYEGMRELEVHAKMKEIDEKAIKNEQNRIINRLIDEEKLTPPVPEIPGNITVTTNVNTDDEK